MYCWDDYRSDCDECEDVGRRMGNDEGLERRKELYEKLKSRLTTCKKLGIRG
jgi:hypothetical protein